MATIQGLYKKAMSVRSVPSASSVPTSTTTTLSSGFDKPKKDNPNLTFDIVDTPFDNGIDDVHTPDNGNGSAGGGSSTPIFPSYTTPTPIPNDYETWVDSGRHAGIFHKDNPYYRQLEVNTNKKDRDALYELAIKWEAENYSYERQLKDRQAALDEQRAYDDPLAQIARQRKAGINPDLGGASGSGVSGSSASMPLPDIDTPTNNTSKFNNRYDNVSQVLDIVNTGVNIASTALQAVDVFSGLASKVKLAKSSAYVADKTQGFAVASAAMNSASSAMNLINGIGEMFGPDATDEQMSDVFTSFGVPQEQVKPLISTYRQYQDNPHMKAYFAKGEREMNESEQYNDVYTAQVTRDIISQGYRIKLHDMTMEETKNRFMESVYQSVYNPDNVSLFSDNIKTSEQLELDTNNLALSKVSFDAKVFSNSVAETASIANNIRKTIQSYYDRAAKQGRSLTITEKAFVDSLRPSLLSFESAVSDRLGSLALDYNVALRNAHMAHFLIDYEGDFNDAEFLLNHRTEYVRFNYDGVFNSSNTLQNISEQLYDSIMQGLKLALTGGKGGKLPKVK